MTRRDFCLARLAVARATLRDLGDDVHNITELFIDPEEDPDGSQRIDALEACELGLQSVLSCLTSVQSKMAGMDPGELAEPEESEDDDQDDDGDSDDDSDDGDDGDDERAA